jgi:hypothetical protein
MENKFKDLNSLIEAIEAILPNADIQTDGSESNQIIIYTGLSVNDDGNIEEL